MSGEVAKLHWQQKDYFLVAETGGGTYQVFDTALHGYGGIGAFFRPAQGRARLPKDRQPLGNVKTIEEAKARCEQHYERRSAGARRAGMLGPTEKPRKRRR